MKMIIYLSLIFTILFLTGCTAKNHTRFNTSQSSFTPNMAESSKKPLSPSITPVNTNNSSNQKESSGYTIPVLMYHYIRDFNNPNDKIGTNLSVSPENFEKQLKWFKDNGFETVDFKYLLNGSLSTLPTGRQAGQADSDPAQDQNHKSVILTFDDGYLDAYTNALPLLKKYGFTATFYIITNNVGKDNFMNWQQINELKKSGMNIGSHTLAHPDLSKASTKRAGKEIFESKKILEEKIGVTISDFCYPSGKYDNRTIELLKEYGYNTAVTVKSGIYDSSKNNLFEIPRIRITNQTDLSKILP